MAEELAGDAARPAPAERAKQSGHTVRGPVTARAPGTRADRDLVAGIWRETLGIERVEDDDNFFDLGGDSLTATRVAGRIRDSTGADLDVDVIFDAPTVAALAARVAAARQHPGPHRRDPGGAEFEDMSDVQAAADEPPPLSFAQERVWFLDQMRPGSLAYNVPLAVRVAGELDRAALERAFGAMVTRHESLRTTFRVEDGTAVQRIGPPAAPSLTVTDLTGVPAAEREEAAQRLIDRAATTPFDLARGPLVRAELLRLDMREHILLVTQHHIITDGWSLGVLIRELTALYSVFHAGRPDPLPPLPLQYADFAAWQRRHVRGEAGDRQLAYWRRRLDGAPGLPPLPADRPRSPVQSLRGAHLTVETGRDLTDRLHTLSRQEDATLFMTLLAVFHLLLGRYGGRRDIVVGSPVAGRRRPEFEPLIGLFTNTLALRVRQDPARSFRSLLAEVRETTLGAYANQDVPFERIVEELRLPRDPGHDPLVQVMFVLQNTPPMAPAADGLTLRPVDTDNSASRLDLTLVVTETDGVLRAMFEYRTDLFERDTIRRLGDHYLHLLTQVAADPEAALRDLVLPTPAERRWLIEECNDSRAAPAPGETFHRRFEAQVARTPDAVALVAGDQTLTYAELNARANQVAHRLIVQGARPDGLFGLCVERSPEMIIGLLGILKAGAAFLPLDPEYPPDRLAYMLRDARAQGLVTQRHLLPRLPVRTPIAPVCLDRDRETLDRLPATDPLIAMSPDHLAYCIYTSGSTGLPKGVCVAHRSIGNLAAYQRETLRIGPGDRVLQFASISFDSSVWEILALLSGASLVLRTGGAVLGDELTALIEDKDVNVMTVPPSLLRSGALSSGRALRVLMCVGEECTAETLASVEAEHRYNGYGLTETAIGVAIHRQTPDDGTAGTLPIGRPIDNARIYVLDERLAPVPVGLPGELYVAGAGLARGYLHRPGLTAERFVADPFTGDGGRMYRTGDLGRRRADGRIEFLGRCDHQVKIRGFRIEPGEIESRLLRHPAVREALVLAREDETGRSGLVAYLVAKNGRAADAGETALRAHLKRTLPDHMVPTHFVRLERMPLGPNGKIDRGALPAPAPDPLPAPAGNLAPRTVTERLLAACWSQVLRREPGSVHDGFFELGGHSLLATRLVTRLRQVFGVELPVRAVFEAPRLGELAGVIERAQRAGDVPVPPPLVRMPRPDEVPLSYGQQRLWFADQLSPRVPFYYTAAMPLNFPGEFDLAALTRALNALVDRHEILRTAFPAKDGRPVQWIAPRLTIRIPLIDLSGLPLRERAAAVRAEVSREASTPFNLSRLPLLRMRVLRVSGDRHVAVLAMHHILYDAWSIDVLKRELTTLYRAFASGAGGVRVPLPPLRFQYADYALWQRAYLQGETLERLTAYWRRHLDGAPARLELPTDRPRLTVQPYYMNALPLRLGNARFAALGSFGAEHGVTLFMTLMTAFGVLLHLRTGQRDVVVGTRTAGRGHAEVEPLIGYFVNILPMRARIDPDESLAELLARVRHTALEAYAHQDLPFCRLVEDRGGPRALTHAPVFQTMLNVQNAFDGMPRRSCDEPGSASAAEAQAALHRAWGWPARPTHARRQINGADIRLEVTTTADGAQGQWEYNSLLFDLDTIARLDEHFTWLLDRMVAAPGTRIGDLVLPGGAPDRPAAPAVSPPAEPEAAPPVAPRTSLESRLMDLFTEALGRAPAGVHDNFFALGGESMAATRLVWRLREVVRPDLPVRSVFEAQTVGELAAYLERTAVGPRPADGAPGRPRRGGDPPPCGQPRPGGKPRSRVTPPAAEAPGEHTL